MRLRLGFTTFFLSIFFLLPEGAFPQAAPLVTSVVNAASLVAGAVAPGELITITGTNFASGTDQYTSYPVPTTLLNVCYLHRAGAQTGGAADAAFLYGGFGGQSSRSTSGDGDGIGRGSAIHYDG